MTSLIWGVCGQDGSFLAEQLLASGQEVIGVKRRTSNNNTERIKGILDNPNFKLVEGDITDSGSIFSLLSTYSPKRIYNLAAQSHVGTSFNQPTFTWEVTAAGHIKLLEAVRLLKLDTRIYLASSSEQFGDQYDTDFEGNKSQDETTKMNPQSPYAIAKLAAYHANRLYRDSYGLFTCSGILFNHCSERRGEEFVTRKITRWLGRYLSGKTIPKLKLGNLNSFRDWGYAGDYTKVMTKIIENDTPDDFVVGTGQTHSVYDFLLDTFHCVGLCEEEMNSVVEIDTALLRPSEVPLLLACTEKAQNQLNIDLSESYAKMIVNMIEHDIEVGKRETY